MVFLIILEIIIDAFEMDLQSGPLAKVQKVSAGTQVLLYHFVVLRTADDLFI
jgi:hypothetical protein